MRKRSITDEASAIEAAKRSSIGTSASDAKIDAPTHGTPTGAGSEAAEGIHDIGSRPDGDLSGLDSRVTGRSVRDGIDRSGSEPLNGREWIHESGYGGKGGKPRISSDQREDSEREGPLP